MLPRHDICRTATSIPPSGSGGRVLVDFGQLSEFGAVALDQEGRIVLAGCVLVPGFSARGFARGAAR